MNHSTPHCWRQILKHEICSRGNNRWASSQQEPRLRGSVLKSVKRFPRAPHLVQRKLWGKSSSNYLSDTWGGRTFPSLSSDPLWAPLTRDSGRPSLSRLLDQRESRHKQPHACREVWYLLFQRTAGFLFHSCRGKKRHPKLTNCLVTTIGSLSLSVDVPF